MYTFQAASPCAYTKFKCYFKLMEGFFITVIEMALVTPVIKVVSFVLVDCYTLESLLLFRVRSIGCYAYLCVRPI